MSELSRQLGEWLKRPIYERNPPPVLAQTFTAPVDPLIEVLSQAAKYAYDFHRKGSVSIELEYLGIKIVSRYNGEIRSSRIIGWVDFNGYKTPELKLEALIIAINLCVERR